MTTHTLDKNNHHGGLDAKVIFGFWVFIVTDCIMFSGLFSTYAVLSHSTFGNIGVAQTASLPFVLVQTLLFLTSVLTLGFGVAASTRGNFNQTMLWLVITFALGAIFLSMGYHQLANLYTHGHTWRDSAFLSAYFTVIGLQGLHVLIGLLWLAILLIQLPLQKLSDTMRTRLCCFGLFWDFLAMLWLLIFAIVYLMGAI